MEFVTVAQAAKELNVSETTVRRFCYAKRLGEKVGRQWVITREELDRFKKLDRKPGRPKKK